MGKYKHKEKTLTMKDYWQMDSDLKKVGFEMSIALMIHIGQCNKCRLMFESVAKHTLEDKKSSQTFRDTVDRFVEKWSGKLFG